MSNTTQEQWGPSHTPAIIKTLLLMTCSISVFSALTNTLFVKWLGWTGPQELLSLSWHGMRNYFFWQPVSYLFIQDATSQGITISFLMGLLFNTYMLWILGTTLAERLGTYHLLTLYIVSGVLAGLASLSVMPLAGYFIPLAGPSAALLALFIVWTMCNPKSTILLFFLIPIRVKWLLAFVLGAILLITISQGDLVSLVFYLVGGIFGYLYALLGFDLRSPFRFTHPFDDLVLEYKRKISKSKKSSTKKEESKIFDFETGEPVLEDWAFVDAMLTKIAKNGEKSLTAAEKQRLDRISSQKKRQ